MVTQHWAQKYNWPKVLISDEAVQLAFGRYFRAIEALTGDLNRIEGACLKIMRKCLPFGAALFDFRETAVAFVRAVADLALPTIFGNSEMVGEWWSSCSADPYIQTGMLVMMVGHMYALTLFSGADGLPSAPNFRQKLFGFRHYGPASGFLIFCRGGLAAFVRPSNYAAALLDQSFIQRLVFLHG